MKLLWLIDSLTVGGAESLVVPFARKYRGELSIVCMTTIAGNAIEAELRKEGIRVFNLESRNLRDRRAFRRLLDYVRAERFDLIHAHLTYASIWAALVSRRTGIPSVATLHVAPPTRFRDRIKDRLMRFVLNRWASRVIAVSAALASKYHGLKNLVVAHNGIDVEKFSLLPSAFSLSTITVSVLRPGKGIEVLLDAARSVPNVRFVIAGDGPMRAEWTSLAERLGVTDRVEWLGYRNDVHAVLPGHGAFVLPSLDDAFPTVLLEAMASGLPVVATRVGGIPEIVEEGVTGTLVPPNDAPALASAIAGMLARDTTAMRTAARKRAEERFSTEAWIGRLEKIYREVVR